MQLLPLIKAYIQEAGRFVEENLAAFGYFTEIWDKYLKVRKISTGQGRPFFPKVYGPEERDAFYKEVSFDGWGGSSGSDAPLIAYDAILGCQGSWEELLLRAVLHGGDSDSTGILACSWWGALVGFQDQKSERCRVPVNHYVDIEFGDEIQTLARQMYVKVFYHDEKKINFVDFLKGRKQIDTQQSLEVTVSPMIVNPQEASKMEKDDQDKQSKKMETVRNDL